MHYGLTNFVDHEIMFLHYRGTGSLNRVCAKNVSPGVTLGLKSDAFDCIIFLWYYFAIGLLEIGILVP